MSIVIKSTVIGIVIVLNALTLFSQTYEKGRYDSGKLMYERKYDSACRCIKVTDYYPSGKIKNQQTYRKINGNDVLDGETITYFENGQIWMYYPYKKGVPEGRVYQNFENGNLSSEHFYEGGYKTGIWKYYNPDGTLKMEKIYDAFNTLWDSNKENVTISYYLDSQLAYSETYVQGMMTKEEIKNTELYQRIKADDKPLGEKLFFSNCAACHGKTMDIAGPALKGVADTRTNEWLSKMILNGDSLIKSGDPVAVELYEKYYRIEHPNFEHLTPEELQALIEYLKTIK